jgi:hypothetical protein
LQHIGKRFSAIPYLAGVHFSLGQALSASQSSEDRAQAEAQYKDALAENAQDEKAECRLGAIDLDRSGYGRRNAAL